MSAAALPSVGAVLLLVPLEEAGEWGAVVADRNAAGERTALLVVPPGDHDVAQDAQAMGEEVFAGSSWQLVDLRTRTPAPPPGMFGHT